MTTTSTIFILLLILVLGEGMPVTKINKPYDHKKEAWNFADDDADEDDYNIEDKVPLTAKHLSATDIQEQLADISMKVENVLDMYPGLELEIFYSEKDDKIVVKAKVSLQDSTTNIFDDDDDDFTDYAEVINDSLVETDNDDDDYNENDDASDVENSNFTGYDDEEKDED